MSNPVVVTCAGCRKLITRDTGGVYVSHGDIRTAFCNVECHKSLCCRPSVACAKPIPLAAPSAPIYALAPPQRKASLKAQARMAAHGRPMSERSLKRHRGKLAKDANDDDADDEEDLEGSPNEQGVRPITPDESDPYPSASKHGLYAETLALAEPLFAKFPRLKPMRLEASRTAPQTIAELVGLMEEKTILYSSLVGSMKVPKLASHVNINIPNVLMYGPGGTGKTTIAQAIARETGFSLFVPPTSSIINEYLGESAKAFRSAYYSAVLEAYAAEEGLPNAPRGSILFLDEGDELLKKSEKADADTGIATEFKQIVQDSIRVPRFVIIVATNLPDVIKDSAILSRLALKLYIGPPTPQEAVQIVIDDVKRFYDAADAPCKQAQAEALSRLLNALATDKKMRQALAQRLEGYVPREIRAMVNMALAPSDPRGLVGASFCHVPGSTSVYRAIDSNGPMPVGCISAAVLDRWLMQDQTLAVCWLVPTPEKFLERFLAVEIKKSFTPVEIERFLRYAREELVDEKGARRLEQALKRAENANKSEVQAMNLT